MPPGHADTYLCPDCGAEVRVGSKGCPVCLAERRRRTKPKRQASRHPWEQDETHDGLDLPDEDFDYDDFVQREFGRRPHRKLGIKWWWWLSALLLLGWLGWCVVRGWF